MRRERKYKTNMQGKTNRKKRNECVLLEKSIYKNKSSSGNSRRDTHSERNKSEIGKQTENDKCITMRCSLTDS